MMPVIRRAGSPFATASRHQGGVLTTWVVRGVSVLGMDTHLDVAQTGIENITQTIAQQIESHDDQKDRQAGERGDVRSLGQPPAARVDHLAPLGIWWLHPETK